MISKPIKINIPYNKEYSEQEFMDFVYEYFNGFELEYTIEDGYYKIIISRADFLYCENFDAVFQQIGIDKMIVNNYCCLGKKSSLFFSDAWFYYVCVNYLSSYINNTSNLVIIHIDDHKDMMDPFISQSENMYVNLLTQEKVDLLNIGDVYGLIDTGAITIGSMLTPIIYAIDRIKIIHLTNVSNDMKSYSLKNANVSDGLLAYNNRLHLEKTTSLLGDKMFYSVTEPEEIINLIDYSDSVLLHFDMDYFNNRYNGSSDWEQENEHHNPNIEEQMMKIDRIKYVLHEVTKKTRIEHTAIGISPSFYPSEYWQQGIEYLLKAVSSIDIDVQEVKNKLLVEGWLS